MSTIQPVITALLEIKNTAMSIQTEEQLKSAMPKYDSMLILGEKINTIYANDLQRALEKVFHYEISMSDLLNIIPEICNLLKMKVEPMTIANDPERKLADYQITLFE